MSLNGRTALITGCGSGIGREVAITLAKLGVKIIMFGGRNIVELEKTANIIKENNGLCKVISGDLTDFNVLGTAFNQAIDGEEKIDFLINNAGLAHNGKFESVTEQIFEKIMDINVKVPYFLTQKALPYLRKSNSATVINLSSVVGHAGYENQSIYTVSKHAILGFTKSLAVELYKENVRVHAISPGGVYTDMIKVTRPDLSPDGMIMPKDIADIIVFILTHRNNAVIDEFLVHRVGKQPFMV